MLLACWLPSSAAAAGDTQEVWPELSAYVKTGQLTRLYLDLSYAQERDALSRSLEMGAYLDVSIKPIVRRQLRDQEWARKRYLWSRVGYVHVLKGEGNFSSPSEDRGVVSLLAKFALPNDVWFEGRTRADLRWIEGEYSTRYRFRAEVNREWFVWGHAVAPYFHVEWIADSRYGGLSRVLYEGGPELTLSSRFRFEIYGARQVDRLPQKSVLTAIGVVAKWYF